MKVASRPQVFFLFPPFFSFLFLVSFETSTPEDEFRRRLRTKWLQCVSEVDVDAQGG
jgi:hypothetical protein